MLFNINNTVRVRLTDAGREYHRRIHNELYARIFLYRPPEEDADGWSRWQLWSLMQTFGPGVSLGGPTLYEPTIDLVTE